MSEEVTKRTQDSLAEKIRELEEAKRILEDVEVKALSGVALALTEAAESLAHTAKDLSDMRATEWMTAEQAAQYLGCESVKAFEKIAARQGIPRHYLSARTPRYNRAELDAWLTGRRGH
jgi:hypothetical protein